MTITEEICGPGEHIIGEVIGAEDGPTLIIVGGVHGNEPAGVLAAKNVLSHLTAFRTKMKGRVIFLAGNTRALVRDARYINEDLNRHWNNANVYANSPDSIYFGVSNEDTEQNELLKIFQEIFSNVKDEVYVLDLHSTSADGVPFVTLGDTLRNRAFAKNFPTTIVLGIEEQLEGTMLEYLNNLGAVTLGFEGGQHQAAVTVENHEAVIWIALTATGCLSEGCIPHFERYKETLKQISGGTRFVEVRYRHALQSVDEFRMHSGYKNFQPIKRGEILAYDKKGKVRAKEAGLILMPLYQPQGDDGFFLVREVKGLWLTLSKVLRRLNLSNLIHLLPGVSKNPKEEGVYRINTKIARLFPLQVFHLLGFRKLRWADNLLTVSRRLHDTVSPFKK